MKRIMLVIVLILFFNTINGQNPKKIIGTLKDFLPNETAYLFGDKVKFKSKPTVDAEVIEFLKIGTQIKILEKTKETYVYKGVVWPWYKVMYNNKKGYILGGLISYNKKTILNDTYLASFKERRGIKTALIRVVDNNTGNYFEQELPFGKNQYFSFRVFYNKGIASIKSMVRVDFSKENCETCEEDGYYLFFDGKSIKKAIKFYSFEDVLSWVSEKVIFPTDEGGKKGKILYSREEGKLIEASIRRKQISREVGEFIWNGEFITLK